MEPLDEPRRDDPDHALMPVLAPDDVAAAAPLRVRPGLDLAHGVAEDPLLDSLALAVQRIELARELPRPPRDRRSGGARSAAPGWPSRPAALIRGASRKATAPASTVAGSTRRAAHQRGQAGLRRACQATKAPGGEAAVLVDERDDVGDRREPDEIEVLAEGLVADERLARACRRHRFRTARGTGTPTAASPRAGSRAARSPGRWWSVTTTSQPELGCRGDLVDGGDPAVDREDEAAALVRKALERLAGEPVSLLEAARQVPVDLRARSAGARAPRGPSRRSRRRRSRRARRCAARTRSPTGSRHRPRPCPRAGTESCETASAARKARASSGVAVPSPDEDACSRLADRERFRKRLDLPAGARTERPGALVHTIHPRRGVGRKTPETGERIPWK